MFVSTGIVVTVTLLFSARLQLVFHRRKYHSSTTVTIEYKPCFSGKNNSLYCQMFSNLYGMTLEGAAF